MSQALNLRSMPERATLELVLALRETRPFVPVGRVQFAVDGGFGAICSVLELLDVGEVLIKLMDDPSGLQGDSRGPRTEEDVGSGTSPLMIGHDTRRAAVVVVVIT